MASASTTRSGLGVLGAGAVACAACCAGPIVGFVAATGLASALGVVLFGLAGLIVVAAVTGVLWYRRRRRQTRCAAPAAPVTLAEPRVRARR